MKEKRVDVGLYHIMVFTKKPGTIRVVSRPDLANQIFGVLLRFRKEHVAFMVDIKSMFYQVSFTPKKSSSLFVKVVDYQMFTHIFGFT